MNQPTIYVILVTSSHPCLTEIRTRATAHGDELDSIGTGYPKCPSIHAKSHL